MAKQQIQLNNQYSISYQEYGEGEQTLILFHGLMGSSWLNEEWSQAIEKAGLRLIALERIGYGDSSQFEIEHVGDWIPIIQKIFQKLALDQADLIGISAGAPYAYASASGLPDRIQKVHILSGVPAVYEDSILAHYKESDQIQYRSFLEKPMSEIQQGYKQHMEGALEGFKKGGMEYFVRAIEEILQQDCYGMALESRLQIRPWNISLSGIEQEIIIYHSKDDEIVPYPAAREMLRHFQNASFKESEITGENAHMRCSSHAFLEILKGYC